MNGKELLDGMSFVHSKYVQEAEDAAYENSSRHAGIWKKPLVIAAIIGLMILLMGSAVVIRTVLAESDLFDYPLVDPSKVPIENINLTVDHVSNASMRIYCDIDGVEYGKNSIYILSGGPFVIEKKTEKGWEELPSDFYDPAWDADEVLTSGTCDWYVDWSGMYGLLESGTYRYVAIVLEGNVPVSVEFTVAETVTTDLQTEIQNILVGGAYHVRGTEKIEFGSMDHLPEADRETLVLENATYTYEYVKSGEDLLYLCHREGKLWIGMMYKDGIKYSLDFEDDDRSNPVIGWSPNPDLDMSRLTEWVSMLTQYLDECTVEYRNDGSLARVIRPVSGVNGYEISYTGSFIWEIVSTESGHAAEMIANQDVNVAREFNWDDDRKNMKSLDVEYVNKEPKPVATASEAIARAMAECTVEHDKILCYRDEKAGMWKVEFQIMYGYQGYQFIYLNDEGITQMVSGAGSKEPAWKDLYPDP